MTSRNETNDNTSTPDQINPMFNIKVTMKNKRSKTVLRKYNANQILKNEDSNTVSKESFRNIDDFNKADVT